jgi:hypothetical protein
VRGVTKFERTKKKLFMPETSTWYLPQAENNSHHVDLGPTSVWAKNLPIIKDAHRVMKHLHNKTHFKSANSLFLQGDVSASEKIDTKDMRVCELIQNM